MLVEMSNNQIQLVLLAFEDQAENGEAEKIGPMTYYMHIIPGLDLEGAEKLLEERTDLVERLTQMAEEA